MGVKDLWSILSPSCEKKSLWELEGLTIAVDLSSWIIDSQNIKTSNSVANIYLRNLFFRTSYLLLLGVKLVFVLEGKAPTLKHGTMARRQQAVNENGNPPQRNGNRGRLNQLQKQCEDLLLSLGVKCYRSEGEAEALCSKLNELGIVDAVISQDSDCFLYGAKVVLRNFTMTPSYTCEMYTMENIKDKLSLGRQKLLALSLLCGCDYEAGVQGIGKQSALKFLGTLPDDEVLDRLRGWRHDVSYELQSDTSPLSQNQKEEIKIRKKALLDPNFPSEEVISEFLSSKTINLPSFVWLKPSLKNFTHLAQRMLVWEDDYIHSKFLPLLTRWHLVHGRAECGLELTAITKKRSVRGVPSYELKWQHDWVGEFTTIEPAHLVAQHYSELHDEFINSKKKPTKGTKREKKKCSQEDQLENIENMMEDLTIDKKIKQTRKTKSKKGNIDGLQTLDRFILQKVSTNIPSNEFESQKSVISHSTPIRNVPQNDQCTAVHDISSEDEYSPSRKNNTDKLKSAKLGNVSQSLCTSSLQNSLNLPSFIDSSEDSAAIDLSGIINSIVSRPSSNPAVKIWSQKH